MTIHSVHLVFKIILHGTLNGFYCKLSVLLIISLYCALFFALDYMFSLKNEISCTCDNRHLNTHLGHKNVVLAV